MDEIAPRRRAAPASRLALILAAERLMALRGVAGVSLREINEAAGLKNVSAAHYHFGSREGVVAAILGHRVPPIQARRRALAERLLAGGGGADIRSLVGALVWPLVDEIRPRPEGNYYLRFIEQIRREPQDSPLLNFEGVIAPSWGPITAQLRAHLKPLPPQLAALRIRLEYSHMVSGLASIETWIEQGEISPGDLRLAAEILIDGVVQSLSSPPSADTLQLFRGG